MNFAQLRTEGYQLNRAKRVAMVSMDSKKPK